MTAVQLEVEPTTFQTWGENSSAEVTGSPQSPDNAILPYIPEWVCVICMQAAENWPWIKQDVLYLPSLILFLAMVYGCAKLSQPRASSLLSNVENAWSTTSICKGNSTLQEWLIHHVARLGDESHFPKSRCVAPRPYGHIRTLPSSCARRRAAPLCALVDKPTVRHRHVIVVGYSQSTRTTTIHWTALPHCACIQMLTQSNRGYASASSPTLSRIGVRCASYCFILHSELCSISRKKNIPV